MFNFVNNPSANSQAGRRSREKADLFENDPFKVNSFKFRYADKPANSASLSQLPLRHSGDLGSLDGRSAKSDSFSRTSCQSEKLIAIHAYSNPYTYNNAYSTSTCNREQRKSTSGNVQHNRSFNNYACAKNSTSSAFCPKYTNDASNGVAATASLRKSPKVKIEVLKPSAKTPSSTKSASKDSMSSTNSAKSSIKSIYPRKQDKPTSKSTETCKCRISIEINGVSKDDVVVHKSQSPKISPKSNHSSSPTLPRMFSPYQPTPSAYISSPKPSTTTYTSHYPRPYGFAARNSPLFNMGMSIGVY